MNCLHPATYMDTTMVRQAGVTPSARSSRAPRRSSTSRLAGAGGRSGLYFNGLREARADPQAYDPEGEAEAARAQSRAHRACRLRYQHSSSEGGQAAPSDESMDTSARGDEAVSRILPLGETHARTGPVVAEQLDLVGCRAVEERLSVPNGDVGMESKPNFHSGCSKKMTSLSTASTVMISPSPPATSNDR